MQGLVKVLLMDHMILGLLGHHHPILGLLLRFIASNGSVSIKQIKDSLGLNTGSIYHHLSKLENLVEQDAMNRYRLSAEGMRVLGLDVPSSMSYSSDYTIQVLKIFFI